MPAAGLEFSEAKPEFARFSEAEVWAAIDRNDDNRIACEVTRLICCFWKKFLDCAKKYQNIPPEILHVSVHCPIERVAVVMLTDYIRSGTGHPLNLTLH